MQRKIDIDERLNPNTKIYRYVSAECFFAFVESKYTYLTNINQWPDKWEAILEKVPVLNENLNQTEPLYSFHEEIYGQSWSMLEESDALWRIYSPNNTGIAISTSIEKFELIEGIHKGILGKVIYFDNTVDLMNKAENNNEGLKTALFKRIAFKHEEEVRLLTHNDFVDNTSTEKKYIYCQLDPLAFIEGVTIDPRANDWFVKTIKSYCKRVGFDIIPEKSTLYDSDAHNKTGLIRKYIPTNKK
ncbi:MAG: DUF2971 domain-containing protein [Deltaproteobacteria bacterium]|nr:DUF2971 domain-containing protein [Deltaproteobacteria bacterium]